MCSEPFIYVTMLNDYIYNICCPTTTWMCTEADKECFYDDSDIRKNKPKCVKCYYCLFPIGMVKDIILSGDFTPTFPTGVNTITGTYDGTVSNLIQIIKTGAAEYWMSISKPQ